MLNQIRSLFSQSIFYSLGNLFAKASGLIILPLYALYVSKEEIGLLALYETTYVFVLSAAGWGSKSGFARIYNEMPDEASKRSLFFTTYLFNLFSSLLAISAAAIILFNLELFQLDDYKRVIFLFCASSFFKLLYDVPVILLRLQQRAAKQVAYQIANVILTVLLTIYALKVKKMGFVGVFYVQMIANGTTLFIMLPLILKNCTLRIQTKALGEMIHYGYPLALSNILTLVLTISDRYILEAFYSLETVGSFSIAVKVANLLQFLVISSFYTSYYYQYYKTISVNDDAKYHEKIFTYFVLLIISTGLIISLFGKEIIFVIMAGKTEYFDAIPVIPLLILGLMFSAMRQVFVLPITKAKQTRLISMVLIISGILNLGLNFVFIPYFGQMGAAFTTAFSQLFAAIWFLIKVYSIDKVRYEWRKVAIILITGILVFAFNSVLPSYHWMVDILVKLICLILFLAGLYLFRFFDDSEMIWMKQVWHKWRDICKLRSNIKSLKGK